jgi:hypothetical protein
MEQLLRLSESEQIALSAAVHQLITSGLSDVSERKL